MRRYIFRLHPDVISASQDAIRTSPFIEVGGKFVGRIRSPMLGKTTEIELAGTIPSGPTAVATSTSLHPDGDYQADAFAAVVAMHPDTEHVGSWHSHHPNGLDVLSRGDDEHYWSVINDPRHRPSLYVAGLCIDARGLADGRFWIYTRRSRSALQLPDSNIVVDDRIESVQPDIEIHHRLYLSSSPRRIASKIASFFGGSGEAAVRLEDGSYVVDLAAQRAQVVLIPRVGDGDSAAVYCRIDQPGMRLEVTFNGEIPPSIPVWPELAQAIARSVSLVAEQRAIAE